MKGDFGIDGIRIELNSILGQAMLNLKTEHLLFNSTDVECLFDIYDKAGIGEISKKALLKCFRSSTSSI